MICLIFFLQVNHSYDLNEKQVTTWVAVQDDGLVLCGHCSCMAGLGEVCSHVGAVLYDTRSAVNKANATTCTDKGCYWLGPSMTATRNVDCLQGCDMQFTKKQRTNLYSTTVPSTSSKLPPPTQEERQHLYEALQKTETKEKCAILSMVPGHAQRYIPRTSTLNLPKPLQSLYHPPALKWSREQLVSHCKQVYEDLDVTLEQVGMI